MQQVTGRRMRSIQRRERRISPRDDPSVPRPIQSTRLRPQFSLALPISSRSLTSQASLTGPHRHLLLFWSPPYLLSLSLTQTTALCLRMRISISSCLAISAILLTRVTQESQTAPRWHDRHTLLDRASPLLFTARMPLCHHYQPRRVPF